MGERHHSIQPEGAVSPETQEQQKRAPFFVIVGAPGAGKTELLGLMTESLGISPIDEKFAGCRDLVNFYTSGHPEDYSFKVQMHFLGLTSQQTLAFRKPLATRSVVQDQGMDGNWVIAETQHRLKYMSGVEFSMYTQTLEAVANSAHFPKPDIYIALTASYAVIEQRIVARGRAMELQMRKNHPDYFPALVESFDNWIHKKAREEPVIVIDTSRIDICKGDGADFAVKEICDWTTYYLTSPNQFHGKTRDGKDFILPNFVLNPRLFLALRNNHSDRTPGARRQS